MKVLSQCGYKSAAVRAGTMHHVAGANKKTACVGSRIPAEVLFESPDHVHVCVHRVQYANRKRHPLTAVVALHHPGGVVQELTKSATVNRPVLAVQMWPCRGSHLQRFNAGNAKAAQAILAELGGSTVTIYALPTSTSMLSKEFIAVPYHNLDSKWVCTTCGTMFDSAELLAQHDGAAGITKTPRRMLPNGALGHCFETPTSFSGNDAWKTDAIAAIEAGNVQAAMKTMPTMRLKPFADKVKLKLLALPKRL